MDVVEEIKKFVEKECKKSSNKYGYGPFNFHFIPTVAYANKLADELGGNKEVILIAAWLHDIGSIVDDRENHHITGAKIAEKKLKELKYPVEKIRLVKKCILNHRGSRQDKRKTIEEQVVVEADVMSNFDDIAGLFQTAFVEKLDRGEAKNSVRQKLKRKWNQLHFENSKKIIRPKYKAVMLLLK